MGDPLGTHPTPLPVVRTPAEFAFLHARPGRGLGTPGDLAGARLLTSCSRWPVHLADDHRMRVVSGDDLVLARSV
ncbi:hypothetical protein [Nocardioides sp.]|uniref:hypothetical protein n=1 Tax=Nocardioides sp. TaxID=35761 RepID=UPI003511E69D